VHHYQTHVYHNHRCKAKNDKHSVKCLSNKYILHQLDICTLYIVKDEHLSTVAHHTLLQDSKNNETYMLLTLQLSTVDAYCPTDMNNLIKRAECKENTGKTKTEGILHSTSSQCGKHNTQKHFVL